jgi:hypothetical protein
MPEDAGFLGSAELRKSYDSLVAQMQALGPKLGDRRTATAVQELSLRLGYFALALQQQMDGETGKAESSLARADARAARVPSFFNNLNPLDDWTQTYH